MPPPPRRRPAASAAAAATQRAATQRRLTALSDPLPGPQELLVGRGMAYLLLRAGQWVHRRVEFLSFLDHENVRRQMSVDCTPPYHRRSVGQMFAEVGPVVPISK